MKLMYYIKGDGGIGKEFVVLDEDEAQPSDHEYEDFEFYKEVETSDDNPMVTGAHYMKDT